MGNFSNFIRSASGATAITFAVSAVVVLGVVGVAIDTARYHVIYSKAQGALDAAVLAAAIDVEGVNPEAEGRRVFHANFPTGYLGTQLVNLRVTRETIISPNRPAHLNSRLDAIPSASVNAANNASRANAAPVRGNVRYTGNVDGSANIRIPNTLVQLLSGNEDGTISVYAKASNNLDITETHVEIAFVLDNSGSMGFLGGVPIVRLREAATYAVDLLFDEQEESDYLHISVIPYSVAVAFRPADFPHARNWTQTPWLPRYDYRMNQFQKGYLATRNNDNPVNAYVDISDAAPTSEATRFRTPGRLIPGQPAIPHHANLNGVGGEDQETSDLAPVIFGSGNKAELHSAIALQTGQAGAYTRINVGALWGWLALSPNWRGIWSASKPDLPRDFGSRNLKFMVLMTDGTNTTFYGASNTVNDDVTLTGLCSAIKEQGITLYTIVLETGTVNFPLMQSCATSPLHAYLSPTPAQLAGIFESIVIDIKKKAKIRLVQ